MQNRIKHSALHIRTYAKHPYEHSAYADYLILPTIPDDNALHGLLCLSTEFVDVKEDVNPHLSVLGVLITLDENNRNKNAYRQVLELV